MVFGKLYSKEQKDKVKCALIEHNFYHQETLPTFAYLLNKLGIKVDVYTSREGIKNNVFYYCSNLRYSLKRSDKLTFKLSAKIKKYKDYDFIIINSLEPKSIMFEASKLHIPTLAVVHNANLLIEDHEYISFFSTANRIPIVLAKHIVSYLNKQIKASWIAPLYLGSFKNITTRRPIFCVQGNLEYSRRNYDSLIESVESLLSDGIDHFIVMLIGRNNTLDGTVFKKKIHKRNLSRHILLSDKNLSYRDYFNMIKKAQFILPLLDRTSEKYNPYFSYKITSSISIALGSSLIPIVHKDLAKLYEIEDSSFIYNDGELYKAMKKAIYSDKETLNSKRRHLKKLRENMLNISQKNLKISLSELGLIEIYPNQINVSQDKNGI